MSSKNLDEIELKQVTQWFQVNLLSLNISKTSYIIVGNKSSRNLKLVMQEAELGRSLETKYLGGYYKP